MITVDEFIEKYNQHIDWNAEVRDKLNIELLESNPVTKDIIDGYLSAFKITPNSHEIESAKIYDCDKNNTYELQAYSYESYHIEYFWCNPDITKEEYLNERVMYISQEAQRHIEEIQKTMGELQHNLNCVNTLFQDINK